MVKATLSWNEMRDRAFAFVREWKDETSEKAEAQSFWTEWFGIFGLKRRGTISYEQAAKRDSTGSHGWLDAFWPKHLAIEHKSAGKSLEDAIDQAVDYLGSIEQSDWPRYVMSSDFQSFLILDLETGEKTAFPLAELPQRLELFGWIAGYQRRSFAEEDEVNVHAAELMGRLYDLLDDSGYGGHDLDVLLVRLVFIMFADDTSVWEKNRFTDYLVDRTAEDGADLGPRLSLLFQVLDTPKGRRQTSLDEDLARFPHINGDLFAETIRMPSFDRAMRERLIEAAQFDWSGISPAVFGSMFQSVMDKEQRRNLGAHYTREQNILKVIEPLFLDELRARLDSATSVQALRRLRHDLSRLTFFDPACGCGNFLIVAYRELRRLELELLRKLRELEGGEAQLTTDLDKHRSIAVDQFYGVDIEEFPVRIAQVAMYLVDHLANLELDEEFGMWFPSFPITSSAHIELGNALRMDWRHLLPAEECSYLFGNPPFHGMAWMNADQQDDNRLVFAGAHAKGLRTGRLDYVACWYAKAIEYLAESDARAAFVSTNSLTQGEQARTMDPLLARHGFEIDFAHQTFPWTSEARGMAHVHVVIIGFSKAGRTKTRMLYEYPDGKGEPIARLTDHINFYLQGHATTPAKRYQPLLTGLPQASKGSQPTDGGHLIIETAEYDEVAADPIAAKYLRPFRQSTEMLHDRPRWCLWLVDAPSSDLRASAMLKRRLTAVAEARSASKTATVKAQAKTPALFTQIRQPARRYLALPEVSSKNRDYIPGRFYDPEVIAGNKLILWPDAPLWLFGYLQSAAFTAWVRAFAGRMKSDFSISPSTVYFTFPFVRPTGLALSRIEQAAQAVLDARGAHAGESLADLYDQLTMPRDLRQVHDRLDAAIDGLYRLRKPTAAERFSRLGAEYAALATPLETIPKRRSGSPSRKAEPRPPIE
jgi:type I restriction-modification system DNA methylase subunit